MSREARHGLHVETGWGSSGTGLPGPHLYLSVSAEALILAAAGAAVTWRVLRARQAQRQTPLGGPFGLIAGQRRLTHVLAQIAALTQADRTLLTAFHRPHGEPLGYEMKLMSTINQFVMPGAVPMRKEIANLPVGRIILELEEMMRNGGWTPIVRDPEQPEPCRSHLERNEIYCMYNRLVMIEGLPYGILSIQYTRERESYFDVRYDEGQMALLEALYEEVVAKMRSRLTRPPLLQRLRLSWQHLLGQGTQGGAS